MEIAIKQSKFRGLVPVQLFLAGHKQVLGAFDVQHAPQPPGHRPGIRLSQAAAAAKAFSQHCVNKATYREGGWWVLISTLIQGDSGDIGGKLRQKGEKHRCFSSHDAARLALCAAGSSWSILVDVHVFEVAL